MSHKNKNKAKGQDPAARNETRVPPPNPAEDISLEGRSLGDLDVQEGQERMQGETRPLEQKSRAKSGASTPGKDAGINPQSAGKQAPNDEL